LPPGCLERRPPASAEVLAASPAALGALAIDHAVPTVAERGGALAGAAALSRFLAGGLAVYADGRNDPETAAASELSAYLHHGQVGAHQVFLAVARHFGWTPLRLGGGASGAREGWWGMPPAGEAFLDQLVTWREVGFNACARLPAYDRYDSLPAWARRTLEGHAGDPRPDLYSFAELEEARTHDPLWNAAQRQLLREGRIHNYLRMLWGKKVLEWSPSPREAFERLVALNDRWAIDGRDPNSYSGIAWCLGRYDRPWAPVRPIFGSIRYMSSANTARKLRVKGYLARYGPLGG
jgi:deoxyribodipyrimidine photo-lyase